MTSYQARLIYDSERADALAGLRGYRSRNRTILFACEALGVDLVVIPNGTMGPCLVHGQVRRPDDAPEAGAHVGFGKASAARTDSHGQFSTHWPRPEEQRVMSIVTEHETVVCVMPDLSEDRQES